MRYLICLFLLLLVSCGESQTRNWNQTVHCVSKGSDCHVESDSDSSGSDVPRASNTPESVPGPAGPPGATGATGQNGGPGIQGPSGSTGPAGSSGTSCSAQQVVGGAIITCGSDMVVILHGTNGIDGADGQDGVDGTDGVDGSDGLDAPPTPYTVTELVDPCGDGPGFDEVILRLGNGSLMAHYAGGGNLQFLTVIGDGNYVTTDNQSCNFSIASGIVSW